MVESLTSPQADTAFDASRQLLGREGACAAEARLREAVAASFGRACKAVWLSGSFVYKGEHCGRSDIDVVIVLDESVPVPADRPTVASIEGFIDAYLEVHARHGLDPDLDFPAEYVVPSTIEQAIEWRGLALDGAMATKFPSSVPPDYWLDRPDRWFHAWLSMTAFSRFLAGDRDWHAAAKVAAWRAILRFILLGARRPLAEVDLPASLAQFGMKPSYQSFWTREREWIRKALGDLAAENCIVQADGMLIPDAMQMNEWRQRVEERIEQGDDGSPLLLPPELHRAVADYAARRWDALSPGGT